MVTGSYNWTNNAERFNYENAIFITDPNVIGVYQKEFDSMWRTAPNVGERIIAMSDWHPPVSMS